MMAEKSACIREWLAGFRKAQDGAVTMIFALALPAMLGLAGGAADYAAISQTKARLKNITDSAALAVVREMTLSAVDAARAQSIAQAVATAQLGQGESPITVLAAFQENGLAIKVTASQNVTTPFGILKAFGMGNSLETSALARVTAATMQTKLCMLSLGEKVNGGLFMHNNAAISAPECVLHSNSTQRAAVVVQNGSKVLANLVCAKGGISNSAGILQTTLLTDCPTIADPLRNKPEPPQGGPCNHINKRILMGTHSLDPGVYCNGLTIEKNAKVTLKPGIYVFRNGPLKVLDNAELQGQGVSLLMASKRAYFRFLGNSLINISAPTTGIAAGMLIWETRSFQIGLNSWQKNGCGTGNNNDRGGLANNANDVDDDDDSGPTGCSVVPGAAAPPKKTNEHHINSDRARNLTGTIYIPNGLLLVDSRLPVADQSPFTVLVANKIDLYDGPNLVLNANYSGSPVPVPVGLGAIGATQVRLGQ